jgi:signal peptidase I
MKVIDVFNKIARGEEIGDFTVGNGDRIYGVYGGILVDKDPKGISKVRINDMWLNEEIHFLKKNIDVCSLDLVIDLMHDLFNDIK